MTNKVLTLLEDGGEKILAFLKDANTVIQDGVTAAKDAEPIVDVAFPGISVLFNGTVAIVGTMEAAGAAAVPGGSDGAQKAALALAAAGPLFTAYLQEYGIDPSTTDVTSAINAVVAFLNAIGAPAVTAAASAPSTQVVDGSTITTEVSK